MDVFYLRLSASSDDERRQQIAFRACGSTYSVGFVAARAVWNTGRSPVSADRQIFTGRKKLPNISYDDIWNIIH